MNIEIKKSIKPVNYFDAINILESRLKDLYENNEQELIWTLEHNEAVSYTHLTLPTSDLV